MTRWETPPNPDNPRYSDGWSAQLAPDAAHVAYGITGLKVVTVATSEVHGYPRDEPVTAVRWLSPTRLLVRVAYTRDEVLDLVTGAWSPAAAEDLSPVPPPVVDETFLPLGAEWQGDGVLVSRRDDWWRWSPAAIGPNEQTFVCGQRPGEAEALCLEMPGDGLQAHYDHLTDTWTVIGRAMGLHGTPGYRDGTLVVVSGIPATTPRVAIATLVTPFAYQVSWPARITADVWTFGDVVSGNIGGGALVDTPNRQGIGLYNDGTPWLDRSKPVLGVWISPWDAVQGLRFYPDESKLRALVEAYRVTAIVDEVLALYRAERAAGGFNFAAIEERIAVEVCRQTGCSLTLYDDHVLVDSDGTGTQYRFGLTDQANRLRAAGIGVVCGIRVYPDGQAGWSLEDAARVLKAAGFQVAFTLALYTQAGAWRPTGVAQRLEEMVRIGESVGVLVYDVFGVGRGGESPAWNAWAARWLLVLLSLAPARCDTSRWPRTVVAPPIVVPPAVPVPPGAIPRTTDDPPADKKPKLTKKQKVAVGAAGAGTGLFLVLAKLFHWF